MKNILIKLLLLLSIFVYAQAENQCIAERTNECLNSTNPYLSSTMEVISTPELRALAKELNHDPVKIFNWVNNNIEYEEYYLSRKNALSTYWTKKGNMWDQTSLLITLMRISNIKARYVIYGTSADENQVVAEVLVPLNKYGGGRYSYDWVPLAAWFKKGKREEGIDLFAEAIPDELNFSLTKYINTNTSKTTLEVFEEKLQEYLNKNYTGKSLKDIPYKIIITKRTSSVLPLSLSSNFHYAKKMAPFSEVSNEDRAKFRYFIRKSDSGNQDTPLLIDHTFYLPEIATSRVVLDFVPASTADYEIIKQNGGLITKLPVDNTVNVKAVLKVDGIDVNSSSAFRNGDYFLDGHVDPSSKEQISTARKKVGTTMALGIDHLSASNQLIQKWIKELNDEEEVKLSDLENDYTKEKYLGRHLSIMSKTFSVRTNSIENKVFKYLYSSPYYNSSLRYNRAYGYFKDFIFNDDEKLGLINNLNFDARAIGIVDMYKESATEVESSVDLKELKSLDLSLALYSSSYHEAKIFEDWQSTQGASTVTTFMLANQQDIPLVQLVYQPDYPEWSDIPVEDGNYNIEKLNISEMENTSGYTINEIVSIVEGMKEHNKAVTILIPERKPVYEDQNNNKYFFVGYVDSEGSALFSIGGSNIINHGGGTYGEAIVDTSNTTVDLELVNDSVSIEWDIPTDSGTLDVSSTDTVYYEPTLVGDPVDMLKGEFYQIEKPDISIKARGEDLEIQRTYKSQLAYNGIFGYGWSWNHMEKIIEATDGGVIYVNKDGVSAEIKADGDPYTYPAGATYTLAKNDGTGYTLTKKDKSKIIFREDGSLTKKEDANGNSLNFIYDANNQTKLRKIEDSNGRYLLFAYTPGNNNKVQKVTYYKAINTSTTDEVTYSYTGDDLTKFTDLEGHETKYEYLTGQDNPLRNHNMSKYTLPNGDYLDIGYYKNDQVAYHTNAKDETFHFQYSRFNRHSEIWNEEGYYRKVFFNEHNDAIRIDKEDGTIELKAYDENHNMELYTDGNGYITKYEYNDKRDITKKTDPLNNVWRYEYDPRHNKRTKIIYPEPKDANETFVYDTKGNLEKFTDTLDNNTSYEYDEYGNRTVTTDALKKTIVNTYDEAKINILNVKDKKGYYTHFTYDGIGNIESVTDAEGNKKEIDYNGYKQKVEVREHLKDGRIRTTKYGYTKNGQLETKTLSNGAIYTKVYDTARDIVSKSLVIQEIDPLGNSILYTYDKVGNKISETDKRGNVTTYTYDSQKRVVSKIDPLNTSTYYEYDANGKLIKESFLRLDNYDDYNYEDVITKYEYDENSNMVKKTEPNGLETKFEHNAFGKVTLKSYTIDDKLVKTKYEYDAKQRLKRKIEGYGSGEGRATVYSYDELGRKIQEIYLLGSGENAYYKVIKFVYDNNSNLLSKTEVSKTEDDLVTSYEYDKINRVKKVTDANEHTTDYFYEYDSSSKKTSMTDAKLNTHNYSYDILGNLIEEKTPREFKTLYKYNLLNKVVAVTNPNNNTMYIEYDENSNVIEELDFNQNSTQFAYDALNRKVDIHDANGDSITLEYDEAGNVISKTDKTGHAVFYRYDKANYLERKYQYLGSTLIFERYNYDDIGRLRGISDANHNSTGFRYSIFNEKTKIIDANKDETDKEYDKLGRVTKITDNKRIVTKFEYDDFSNLEKVTQALDTTDEFETTYTYDNVGNKLSQTIGKDGLTTSYTYNKLNKLKTVINGNRKTRNTYDADSNIEKTIDIKGNETFYTYDANKNLISKEDAMGNVYRYTYDKNSNLTSEVSPEGKIKQYVYNELNQKVKYIENNDVKEVTYHKNGKVETIIDFNGLETEFKYDELNRLETKTESKGSFEQEVTGYEYYKNSNLKYIKYIVDNQEKKVEYKYDALNRIKEYIDSDTTSLKEYSYDINSNLEQETRADKTVIKTTYDNLNRKTEVRADSILVQKYEYDQSSRIKKTTEYVGNIANITEYDYDVHNRVIQETQNSYKVTKEYDDSLNEMKVLVDGKVIQENSYNANNKLSNVDGVDAVDGGSDNNASISYNLDSQVSSMIYDNGIGEYILFL